jgi:hypothetical protein
MLLFTEQVKTLAPEAKFSTIMTENGTLKIHQWLSDDIPQPTQEQIDAAKVPTISALKETYKRKIYKKKREVLVDNIQVMIPSIPHNFNGDEKSQNRMLMAISVMTASNTITTEWTMADNIIQTVTVSELQEALGMAAQEMSNLWRVPSDFVVTDEELFSIL